LGSSEEEGEGKKGRKREVPTSTRAIQEEERSYSSSIRERLEKRPLGRKRRDTEDYFIFDDRRKTIYTLKINHSGIRRGGGEERITKLTW